MVGGWECQDLSAAGSGLGSAGPKSNTFFALVSLLQMLQKLQPNKPPGWLIENTDFKNHPKAEISKQQFRHVCSVLGKAELLDAAQFGSLAHAAGTGGLISVTPSIWPWRPPKQCALLTGMWG